MSETGAECPECGTRFRAGRRRCQACGWAPSPEPKATKPCDLCGATFLSWTSLTRNVDDGLWRCATCNLAYLKARASKPGDPCPEPGCTKTVAEHIAEFKLHGLRITERVVRL